MKNKLKLAVIALCSASSVAAQEVDSLGLGNVAQDEQAFTFTEAQLGEDDDVSQNISVAGSNSNTYARNVGYRFSAARFKYRAYNSKYNEIYVNGNPLNDIERGEFNFSNVGGLNNQTRNVEMSLPFEDNGFAITALGGSNNYNFRPSTMPSGHRVSLAGANRNYTFRGMYSYNSGINDKGWSYSAALTYRGATEGYIEGTFYNALSYFFGVEKIINDQHSLSLVTWGNPTERAAQAASTDEMYWIANDNHYNPNWGYQNGEKRNARVIESFAPTALLTWDFTIDEKTKLTTTLLGKYSMYSSSRLNYNNSTNPAPDYYSLMPSYHYNVWDPTDGENRTATAFGNWQAAYDYLSASKANRQINWDRLYYANKMASQQGADAMYYQQAYHDDQLTLNLASVLRKELGKNSVLNAGITLSTNKGLHYQTMEDLLGASKFRNINTYVVGTYAENSDEVQYDLNNPNAEVRVGDKFAYDYNIFVNKATAWAGYSHDFSFARVFVNGRISGLTMQREGKMRNGLAKDNSFGKSGSAKFLDGGGKIGASFNLGKGHLVNIGAGYEWKAPTARTAFASPQVNNDFVDNLKNEKVMSAEVGYSLSTSWLKANINGYYSKLVDVTEYSMAYSDIENSFSYISLTGINKEYYGVELGMDIKLTSALSINALGTISEAKYTNNSYVSYMLSDGVKAADGSLYHKDICVNKGMREGGTPLTAASLGLSYHQGGWYIDVIGNYYDRIYLYYSPITRYFDNLDANKNKQLDYEEVNQLNAQGEVLYNKLDQAKGKGGFMLDLSIGKSIYVKKGSLSFNLMLTNVLNNQKICTGGMEQNRVDADETGETIRTYSFKNSPKKFYANGINGMFIVTYKF